MEYAFKYLYKPYLDTCIKNGINSPPSNTGTNNNSIANTSNNTTVTTTNNNNNIRRDSINNNNNSGTGIAYYEQKLLKWTSSNQVY